MHAVLRCLLAGALVVGIAGSASAHFRQPPRCWTTGPGLILKTSQYQQPDGSYDSLSDLIRDVNGTPCGLDCPAPSRVIAALPPPYYCEP